MTYQLTDTELQEIIEVAYDKATRTSQGGYGPDITSLDELLKHVFEALPKKEDIPSHWTLIKCPECGKIQGAQIEHTEPWFTYVHKCENCGYIIGESEWDEVQKTNKYSVNTGAKKEDIPEPHIQFYEYGQSLGIKINDLQRLMYIAKKHLGEKEDIQPVPKPFKELEAMNEVPLLPEADQRDGIYGVREKLKTTFRFYRNDNAPYVGAYAINSLTNGEPIIMFNMEAAIEAIKNDETKGETFRDIVLQTITHEFCHSMQEWLGLEYDELQVERILGAYNEKWNVFNAEVDNPEDEPVFSIPEFLKRLDEINVDTVSEIKGEIHKLFAPYVLWHDAEKRNKESLPIEQNPDPQNTTK